MISTSGISIRLPFKKAITTSTRAVIAVNPNNPTGNFITQEERDSLTRICLENQLPLIVDEVFLDYGLV